MTWSDTLLGLLKDNDDRLIAYVPDNVLTPLLKGATADNYFLSVGATREDEAIDIAASEWVRDEAHFDKLLDRRFDEGGPILLAAKIDDEADKGQTPRDPAFIRSRFMKGLGTGRSGALEAWRGRAMRVRSRTRPSTKFVHHA